jgi:hypothetical protein
LENHPKSPPFPFSKGGDLAEFRVKSPFEKGRSRGFGPISEEWAPKMTGAQEVPFPDRPLGRPADLAAIVGAWERLSQLVLDFGELKELDINPFLVLNEGQGAVVMDVRIFIS